MSMIKCRECGTDISSQAAACPSCGAPLRKRSFAIPAAVIALLVVIAGILAWPHVRLYFALRSAAAEADRQLLTWGYDSRPSMSGTMRIATIGSTTMIKGDETRNQRDERMSFVLRYSPPIGNAAILALNHSDILCADPCALVVRFDNGEPVTFAAGRIESDPKRLSIKDYDGFYERFARAKRVTFDGKLSASGPQSIVFEIDGFNADRYTGKAAQ